MAIAALIAAPGRREALAAVVRSQAAAEIPVAVSSRLGGVPTVSHALLRPGLGAPALSASIPSLPAPAVSVVGIAPAAPAHAAASARQVLESGAGRLAQAKTGDEKVAALDSVFAGEREPSAAADAAELHPERTAMARSGPSVPTRLALARLKGRILDYGAGRGADSQFLRRKGLRVESYDPYYFPKKPAAGARFDWALLNYVLNVVPEAKTRGRILRDIRSRLKDGGRLLVSVRTAKEMATASRGKPWKRMGDGWLTPLDTFQHGYTDAELAAQLKASGFALEQSLGPGIAVAVKAGGKAGPWTTLLKALPFGKKMPSATYLHRSTLGKLPARLQEVITRAQESLPPSARWDLLKLAADGKSISFLRYPDFDPSRHPALEHAYKVELKTGRLQETDFSQSRNKFILHRKETFVASDYPGYARFRSQTEAEEKAGLLSRPDIGTQEGWRKALKQAGW